MFSSLKRRLRPAAAGFFLVAILTAIGGPASAVPAGSYLQSCVNVSQAGDVVKATCRNRQGLLIATAYQVSKCRKPGDNLSNINGHLHCLEVIPPGTYQQTCSSATDRSVFGKFHAPGIVYDGILYAFCKSISGQWAKTQIRVSSCIGGVIANINGRLVCTR